MRTLSVNEVAEARTHGSYRVTEQGSYLYLISLSTRVTQRGVPNG